MDSLEFNKFAAAILVSLLLVMVIGKIGDTLYAPAPAEHAAIEIAAVEREDAPPAEAEESQLAVLLASADPAAGEGVARRCAACHTFEQGGADRVGPNLWGVVGGPTAHASGFAFSSAIAGLGGTWGFEELDAFLADPRGYAPGNRMTFAGLRNAEERADLLVWLNQQSDDPLPLPEAPAEDQAPAEDEAAVEDEAAPSEDGEAEAVEDAADEAAAPAEASGVEAMIAAASADAGESVARQCRACHTFEKDGPNRVGPNMWGVVGRDIATADGFSYSAAMEQEEGSWTYERLFTYLQDPRGDVAGTKMGFRGIRDEGDLAALIAWMRLQADEPLPLEGAE